MVSAIPSSQGDRYQVVRKPGEGGKGIVFLCQDTALSRRVAIKLIKPALQWVWGDRRQPSPPGLPGPMPPWKCGAGRPLRAGA